MSSILRIIKYLIRPKKPESTPVPVSDELDPTLVPVSDELDPTLVPLPDEPPLLFMLPGEILQIISDFLPVSSASCLILSSRKLLGTLGKRSWHLLRSEDQVDEREHFLAMLERDLPDWQLCHPCSLFHPVEQDEGPNTYWTSRRVPECVRRNGFVFITSAFKIRFEHAQLLMNQYRFGRAYNLQRLSNTHTLSITNLEREVVTWPEIIAGELLIRMTQKWRLHGTWDIQYLRSTVFPPCIHYCLGESLFWKTIRCRVYHPNNEPCEDCGKWITCHECTTSFLVDMLEHENSDVEIRVDIRKNLGSCESPFDPKWRQQTDPSTEWATESTMVCPRAPVRPSRKARPIRFRS
jgi:hypothetical protein